MRTLILHAGCALLMAAAGGGLGMATAAEPEAKTAATPSSSAPPAPSSPVVTLKFRQRNGLVMLPVTVNGSAPLSFLLDTGYSINTIHPSLVDSLMLRRAGRVTIVGIAGEEEAPTYAGAEFRLGDVTYSSRRVAAVPSEGQRRRRRDGILGSGLLRRFVVQLDFPAATARFYEPATFVPSPVSAGDVIAIRFRQDTPSIAATIPLAGSKLVTGQFEVDTGCDDGLCLGKDFVAAHQLDQALTAEDADVKRGVGGEARIRSGRVPVLRLGRSEARKVSASFFEDGSPAGSGMAGHIGMDALRQFIVTFDYSRERMILEPILRP